jgi:hypothetical protein
VSVFQSIDRNVIAGLASLRSRVTVAVVVDYGSPCR